MSLDLQVAYTVRLNGLGKGSIEYIPAEDNLCVICKTYNLEEYLCFNHKNMKECVECCGCYDEEEGEDE